MIPWVIFFFLRVLFWDQLLNLYLPELCFLLNAVKCKCLGLPPCYRSVPNPKDFWKTICIFQIAVKGVISVFSSLWFRSCVSKQLEILAAGNTPCPSPGTQSCHFIAHDLIAPWLDNCLSRCVSALPCPSSFISCTSERVSLLWPFLEREKRERSDSPIVLLSRLAPPGGARAAPWLGGAQQFQWLFSGIKNHTKHVIKLSFKPYAVWFLELSNFSV